MSASADRMGAVASIPSTDHAHAEGWRGAWRQSTCSAISSMRLFFFLPNLAASQLPTPTRRRSASRPAIGRNCSEYSFSHTYLRAAEDDHAATCMAV